MHTDPDLEIYNGGAYARGLSDSSGPVILHFTFIVFNVFLHLTFIVFNVFLHLTLQ
jgi:hypothetical protein